MKIIEVLKPFSWSDNGYTVTDYVVGQIVPVSDDCAQTESELGNADVLTDADLLKAQAAHGRLVKAAEKAEAAADKAQAVALELRDRATEARRVAVAAHVGRQAEAEAGTLPEDEDEAAARIAAEQAAAEAERIAAEQAAAEAERIAAEQAAAEAERVAAEQAAAAAAAATTAPPGLELDAPQASLLPPADQSAQ